MTVSRRTALSGLLAATLAGRAAAAARALPQPDPALWDPRVRPMRETRALGPNGSLYIRTYGERGGTPVIVLHGGPAAGHRYMRPYAALAKHRQVAFYDQSGCGLSDAPAELKRYTAGRYVAELEAVRAHLGYKRVILLGHSWGGLLAPMYAAAYPQRVAGLVLAGTAPAWLDFERAAGMWLAELGPAAVATAAAGPRAPGYAALTEAYYARHLCRLDPPPVWFQAEGETIAKNPVYVYLNGPTEFDFTGAFSTLDLNATLPKLRAPTLVTCGEFDEAPPSVARKIVALIPGAKLQVFDGLSHMSHIEDPARVTGVTARFISGIA